MNIDEFVARENDEWIKLDDYTVKATRLTSVHNGKKEKTSGILKIFLNPGSRFFKDLNGNPVTDKKTKKFEDFGASKFANFIGLKSLEHSLGIKFRLRVLFAMLAEIDPAHDTSTSYTQYLYNSLMSMGIGNESTVKKFTGLSNVSDFMKTGAFSVERALNIDHIEYFFPDDTESHTTSGQILEQLTPNKTQGILHVICQQLYEKRFFSIHSTELARLLFKKSFKGNSALIDFKEWVEQLRNSNCNLSLLRTTAKYLFVDTQIENLSPPSFGFFEDGFRDNIIADILSVVIRKRTAKPDVTDNTNVVSPFRLIQVACETRTQTALSSYLLLDKKHQKPLRSAYKDIVYIPCSTDVTTPDIKLTLNHILARLHAYFYPELHDNLTSLESQFESNESPVDLSRAKIPINISFDKALNQVQLALLQRPTLVIFTGLMSPSKQDTSKQNIDTYFVKMGIENRQIVHFIRSLLIPVIDEGIVQKCFTKERADTSCFLILTDKFIDEFSHTDGHAFRLTKPKIDDLQLLAYEAALADANASFPDSHFLTDNSIKQELTAAIAEIGIKRADGRGLLNPTDLAMLYTTLYLKRRYRVDPITVTADHTESVKHLLCRDFLITAMQSNVLLALGLGFIALAPGGIKPITLMRLIERFLKSLNHVQLQNYQPTRKSELNAKAREFIHNEANSLGIFSELLQLQCASFDINNDTSSKTLSALLYDEFSPILGKFEEDIEEHLYETDHLYAYTDDLLSNEYQAGGTDEKDVVNRLFGEREDLLKMVESKLQLDFRDQQCKLLIEYFLPSIFGDTVTGLMHFHISREALFQHAIFMRSQRYQENTYQQYHFLILSIRQGFLALKHISNEEQLHHVKRAEIASRGKFFTVVYVHLFYDLLEDKKRYRLSRKIEASKTQIELLRLASSVFATLSPQDFISPVELAPGHSMDWQSTLIAKDKKQAASIYNKIDQELLLAQSHALRRDGAFKEVTALLKGKSWQQTRHRDHENIHQEFLHFNREAKYPELRHYLNQNRLLVPVDNLKFSLDLSYLESAIHLSDEFEQDLFSLIHDTFTRHFGRAALGICHDYVARLVDMVKHNTDKNGNKVTAEDIRIKVKSIVTDESFSFLPDKRPIAQFSARELSQLSSLLSCVAEARYYDLMRTSNKTAKEYSSQSKMELENTLITYFYFAIADRMRRTAFNLEPFNRFHYINAHRTRAQLRHYFHHYKLIERYNNEITRNYPNWPGLERQQIFNDMRNLLDSLSTISSTSQRETCANLLIEAQYCRTRHKNFIESFNLLSKSERALAYCSFSLLVYARLHSERLKLCKHMLIEKHSGHSGNSKVRYFSEEEMSDSAVINLMKYDYERLQKLVAKIDTPYWRKNLSRRWRSLAFCVQMLMSDA